MSETELVKQCLEYLHLRGILAWRQNQGAMKKAGSFVRFTSRDGISDILAVIPPDGRLLACECKVGRNKPTANQEAFLADVRDAGGLAVVVYSLDDLIKAVG